MMTRTERDKMLAGDLYDAGAPELQADAAAAHEWLALLSGGNCCWNASLRLARVP
jgi:hypothetical protein